MTELILNDEVLSVLKCAFIKNKTEHICENPVLLSCGHFICIDCIESVASHKLIKCATCGQINSNDVQSQQPMPFFKIMLKQNFNLVYEKLFEQFKITFERCCELNHDLNETIDQHVDFIKDQMQLKIESLKIELDQINEKLNEELDEIRNKWQKDSINKNDNRFDLKLLENDLKELENSVKTKQKQTLENFYIYQNRLKDMSKLLDELSQSNMKLSFQPCDKKIQTDIIGEIIYENDIDSLIRSRIKDNKFEVHTICNSKSPLDFYALPNGNLLLANFDQQNLLLFNNNMQLLKTINTIGGRVFGIIAIDGNEENEIYFCDYSSHKIIKTDLEFNVLAEFGSKGSTVNNLYCPSGICCYDGCVFVSDQSNRRIQKFTSNLLYQSTYALNFKPWYIKRINNVACVRANDVYSIFFYDLNNFTMIRQYDGHSGLITTSKSKFYEYYNEKKLFHCYNQKGELAESIEMHGLNLKNLNPWNVYIQFKVVN